jgi:hypothetical protein
MSHLQKSLFEEGIGFLAVTMPREGLKGHGVQGNLKGHISKQDCTEEGKMSAMFPFR